jgi:plastocyanin
MRPRRTLLTALAVAFAALGLLAVTGCADDVDDAVDTATERVDDAIDTVTGEAGDAADSVTGDEGDATVIEIPAAEQGLAFAKERVTAKAGRITLRMPNPSPLPHNIAVDEPERAIGEVVEQGGVSEITLDFPPGEYEYYCSVPGHREGGMVGTLVVE